MKNRTFILFLAPSLIAMILFIALPIVSTIIQSLYVQNDKVFKEIETCNPFGCKTDMQLDVEATKKLQAQQPLGKFNGLNNYIDRGHLAFEEIGEAWQENWHRDSGEEGSLIEFLNTLYNLPFYRALAFTLTYTFTVTPLVIILGFFIALAVNTLAKQLKGVVIFFSLLPMIITPLVGALILFWMIDAQGVIGQFLQYLFDDPDLSLKASPNLTWITLITYGVWHGVPFAFIVFYAGLQTVPQDTLESAMVDGANIWERTKYVIIPHLMPLGIFIALMQLMDNFRVFEPIISFNAEASATSLSWLIYNDLKPDLEEPLYNSGATTSVLTIIGIIILLYPVIKRSWQEHKEGIR